MDRDEIVFIIGSAENGWRLNAYAIADALLPLFEAEVAKAVAAEKAVTFAAIDQYNELREAVETLVDAMCEFGYYAEVDGDGDEGSVLVDHLRLLLHEERAKAVAAKEAEMREYYRPALRAAARACTRVEGGALVVSLSAMASLGITGPLADEILAVTEDEP